MKSRPKSSSYWKVFLVLIILLAAVTYAVTINGVALSPPICKTYDSFSEKYLDTTKWTETTFHGDPFTDEHFVNYSEEAYHIQQNLERDAETNLAPKRQFVSGESLSYQVTYNGGGGNHASQPLINGNYPPSQIENCNYTTAGCGVIGYWNALPDLGAQIGTYNIKYEFFKNQVKMITTKPDKTIVINTFTGNSEPYTLTINTHTGHNGKMHFDYDNFIVCGLSRIQNFTRR